MVSHDIQESFALGTRLLTFDKVRHDPQAPEAYGAARDLRHAADAENQ
jgi:NitT/TauT family transport system ATP-binding protein